jgi:hypothetical protein
MPPVYPDHHPPVSLLPFPAQIDALKSVDGLFLQEFRYPNIMMPS